MYSDYVNTQLLKGIRCPECFSTSRFVIQVTMNLVADDSGVDVFATVGDDHFPERPIADEGSLAADEPISCRDCGHKGTVGGFRTQSELAHAEQILAEEAADKVRREAEAAERSARFDAELAQMGVTRD